MTALALVCARTLLKRGLTWAVVATAVVVAMAGVSLDLFGFDGAPSRSVGVVVGTFEIAGVLLAVGARLSGIASTRAGGFRAALVQTMGSTRAELGVTSGAGIGAASAAGAGMLLVCVVYKCMSSEGLTYGSLVLTSAALLVEAAVAAAWAGLGARVGGPVAGAAVGLGAFVVARSGVALPIRACLPAPVPTGTADLFVAIGTGTLAVLGLVLVASALPAVGEEPS